MVSSWKIPRIWERFPGTDTPKQHHIQTSTFPSLSPFGWNPGTQNTSFFQVWRFYGARKSLVSFQQHNKGILWINTGKLPAFLNHLLIGSTAGRAIQGTEGMGGLQNKDGSNSRCLEDEITLTADGKREREVGSKATGVGNTMRMSRKQRKKNTEDGDRI